MYCDLHAHSTGSDGTDTPTQFAHAAAKAGLVAVALTDHDTIAGLAECGAACASLGIELVPGIEVSADIRAIMGPEAGRGTGELHILGLMIQAGAPSMRMLCDRQLSLRNQYIPRILEALAALGMPLALEEVVRCCSGEVVGRMHVGHAMIARGYVRSLGEAKRYIGRQGPAYPKREFIPPEDAIGAIHGAGGIAVLAHPVRLECSDEEQLIGALQRLKDLGLDGMETLHSDHRPEHVEAYTRIAEDLDLLCTGGSDYHGTNKKAALGSQHVPHRLLERARQRITADATPTRPC